MSFKQITDRLLDSGISLREFANALGVSYSSVKQARLNPPSPSYRKPPANWRAVLAKLVRERGGELDGLADELEEKR